MTSEAILPASIPVIATSLYVIVDTMPSTSVRSIIVGAAMLSTLAARSQAASGGNSPALPAAPKRPEDGGGAATAFSVA